MANQPPRRFRLPSRRVTILLLVLLVVLLSALVAGVLLLRPTSYLFIANQGNSILYVSSPDVGGNGMQLTMLRTSDGAVLWQYKVPGLLAQGRFSSLDRALEAHQAIQIVNGIVYFVVDPGLRGKPDRMQSLMALRASDGKVLWQQQMPGTVVEMLGVGNGVVCLLATVQSSAPLAPILYGFRADTGERLWQRQWSAIVGAQTTYYSPLVIDGNLYAIKTVLSDDGQASPNIYAIQTSNGHTLWEYPQMNLPNQPHYYQLWPILGENGVIAFYGISSDVPVYWPSATRLIGIRESDGTLLWHDELSSNDVNLAYLDSPTSGFFEHNGLLYFVNSYVLNDQPGSDGLQLNAVQTQDGHVLWQKPVTTAQSDLLDMTLANENVYILSAQPQLEGNHPVYTNFSADAFGTSNGARRWSHQSSQVDYDRVQGNSNLALFSSGKAVFGVTPGDGSVLWQRTMPTTFNLTIAGDSGITSALTQTSLDTASASLCALRLDSGATRWCKQFATSLLDVIVGP